MRKIKIKNWKKYIKVMVNVMGIIALKWIASKCSYIFFVYRRIINCETIKWPRTVARFVAYIVRDYCSRSTKWASTLIYDYVCYCYAHPCCPVVVTKRHNILKLYDEKKIYTKISIDRTNSISWKFKQIIYFFQ